MITLQKNQRLKQKKYLWFTLVELIVVIVILAILATIAFLSFNSYSGNSRDSVRLADVSNLNKWIELFNIKSWYYPSPEWTISTWTIFWVELTYKWIIKDWITRMVNINKTPVDPLSSSNYVYWISYDKKYFQIWVVLENSANRTGFFEDALAWSWAWNYFSKINWNYMWIIKFSTWTTNKYYYIANVPSLLYNNMNVDLLNTWTYYIADDNTNLAYQIDPNVTINNKTADVLIKDITNKSTATLTWVDITSVVNSTWTIAQKNTLISNIFSWTILDSFWGDVWTISSSINNWSNYLLSNDWWGSPCSSWNYSNTWTQTYSLTWTLSHLWYLTWTTNVAISNWSKIYNAKLTCSNGSILITNESFSGSCNTNYSWSWATSSCIAIVITDMMNGGVGSFVSTYSTLIDGLPLTNIYNDNWGDSIRVAPTLGSYFGWDLGAGHTARCVGFTFAQYPHTHRATTSIVLQKSDDGVIWTDVQIFSGLNEWSATKQTLTLTTPVTARAFRIGSTVTNGNGYWEPYEFEILQQ